MQTYDHKSTLEEIKTRFDNDVERFSNLETGQQATIDAPIAMELITEAAICINPHSKRVLDIGCGAGNNTLKLLETLTPLDCDLIDLSKPMLDAAKQRIEDVTSGTVRVFQDDFRKVALENDSYDVIFAAAVLHHLRDDDDWKAAFTKIYSLTAKGGCVWILDLVSHDDPNVQKLMWDRYGSYLETLGGVEYRNKVFDYIEKEDSPRSVTFQMNLLREVGFSKVDILHKNSCFATFGAIK